MLHVVRGSAHPEVRAEARFDLSYSGHISTLPDPLDEVNQYCF